MRSRTQTTTMLGLAQTLSWASSYYLPAVLAEPISRAVGMAYSTVLAAFSVALLVSAATGPVAGRLIDRFGGRPVLIASNLVFAAGLVILSQATQAGQVFLAWAVLGIAMGCGLYEEAFARVVRLYGAAFKGVARKLFVRPTEIQLPIPVTRSAVVPDTGRY